ncbi:LuxR C-terminal-related transcriptional regulator [Aphanizomenon sp. CS-733/32]|uniref:LuxR C-terminal-related transcriptional regulator n=1 Tax=Aphanizomenon sp. CS-733/32 TaxID=3021715 RepID=UPI00232A85A3|nr:tetratricopeptide repeat protein [Aphanizomenon sp. CS-733/32]
MQLKPKMNQQEFNRIFDNLTENRKNVLQKILAGHTDPAIAEAMNISEVSVRKYVERICDEFKPKNESADHRRYKRSDLVVLFAKYKPELLTDSSSKLTKELEKAVDKDNEDITKSILYLLSINKPVPEEFKKVLRRIDFSEKEKKEIARSLNKLGHESYLNNDFAIAASYLELAVELNQNYGSAHYNLGASYEKLDNLDGACHHYQIATRYQNRAADAAINNLARLQITQGNSADAVEMIEPILSNVKDNTVKVALHKNLAWAYFQQNSYEQAHQHLLICLELDSNYTPAYCLLAQVQAAQGNQQAARESWRSFLEFYSHDQELKKAHCKLPELESCKLEAMRIINSPDK